MRTSLNPRQEAKGLISAWSWPIPSEGPASGLSAGAVSAAWPADPGGSRSDSARISARLGDSLAQFVGHPDPLSPAPTSIQAAPGLNEVGHMWLMAVDVRLVR